MLKFFYNLNQDSPEFILSKLDEVISDYFAYYKEENRESELAKERIKLYGKPILKKEIKNRFSAFAGISLFPKHGETLDDLLYTADRAIYQVTKASYDSSNPKPLFQIKLLNLKMKNNKIDKTSLWLK